MSFEFVRHEPLYDRILLVLTLDRQKMKERILIGEELQIRFRLQGYDDTEVLCDVTRPLGTMLSTFEYLISLNCSLNVPSTHPVTKRPCFLTSSTAFSITYE